MGALRTPLVCKFLLISLILVGLSSISIANAKVYVVGNTKTWGFSGSYDAWARRRSFVAGDILVFKYTPPRSHNTIRVSSSGYKSCKATPMESRRALWTGNDKFTLKKGNNYFICGIAGHCFAGMKIKVFAR
ncbi:hypothetical protein MKW94_025968 [Papaver nudicaule]|uniref:Phytocyanin domain-containing protein n=1 Tax=Papaver nudicaule TaxID=74823 RepID=A0AA41RVD9_PAPNU|nr:hypothetical protein [Papaver nudicaule]